MSDRSRAVEDSIREFYDTEGWATDDSGRTLDARLFEDARPAAQRYGELTRRRLVRLLPERGERLLDAGSGPVQQDEYVEYSSAFERHVCVDISESALAGARARLGDRGEYVRASLLDLPFPDDHFDAAVSLHVIYHIDAVEQERAVRELIRVVRPGSPILIVYARRGRPLRRALRRIPGVVALKRRLRGDAPHGLYMHVHPDSWWQRFDDVASVRIEPFSMLHHAQVSRIPDRLLEPVLELTAAFEDRMPRLAARLAHYPLIVLVPR